MHPLNLLRRHWVELDGLMVPAACVNANGHGHGHGHGLGSRAVWTPEKLVEAGNSWLLTDNDDAGGVTTQPQASPPNGDFETGDTTGFTSTAGAVSVAAGAPGGTGSWVGRHDGLASSRGRFNGSLTTGNRALARFWVRAGQSCYVGDGAHIDRFYSGTPAAWTFVSAEGTTGATDLLLWQVADGWIEVDNVTTKNLSINAINCKGNLGDLAQATATAMQWSSDADAPTSVQLNGKTVIYSDGVADHSVSSGAASTHEYHKAAGFTYVEVIRPDATAAGTDTLIDTCNAAAANVGITVEYDATNTQIIVRVANGSGTFVVEQASGAGTVPLAAWTRVAVSWSEAAGVIIRTDEDAPVTAASVGAASAADASATLQYGRTSGAANYFHGGRAGMLLKTGAALDAGLVKWLAWAKAYYAL